MYESPIRIIYGQMQTQLEGEILRAVMNTDIQVDKEELIRALRYDRDQYERGFADGHMKAQQGLVRCKNCIHNIEETECLVICNVLESYMKKDDYCSYGERKDNG